MIEFGKYDAYILSAYGFTIVVLIALSIQTLIAFRKTKNKLAEISERKALNQ
jgi:heme exporter protein CcmD